MTEAKYLVIDLETVPDLTAAERLIPGGAEMADALLRLELGRLYARPGEPPETAWIKNVLHMIIAIGVLSLDENGEPTEESRAYCLPDYSEQQALTALDQLLAERPVMVTFNGTGYDLPVLRYRALATSTPMPHLLGPTSPKPRAPAFGKPTDYFHRYGTAHIDLADRLTSYGASAKPSLAEALALIGLTAKDGVTGADVEQLAISGQYERILNYVRRDVEMTAALFKAWLRVCEPRVERPTERGRGWSGDGNRAWRSSVSTRFR